VIFTKIRYKNILSTGNQWTEIDLNRDKRTLIIGDNGAGKSTMLDALSFVLFNKPFRPDFNKPQLVNTIIGKGLLVEVDFFVGKTEYKIVRGISPSIFEVYEGDILLNQDANVRDYQEHLEKHILKFNHRSFCQVMALGTASYVPFMRLPAAARREVVEEILDLKIFSFMNSLLYTKKQENEKAFLLNASEKKLLSQKVDLIKHHNEQMMQSNKEILTDKKERINKAKDTIEAAEDQISIQESNIKNLQQNISDAEKIRKMQDELKNLTMKISTKLALMKKSIGFFKDTTTCPTCTQTIDEDFRIMTLGKKEESQHKNTDSLMQINIKLQEINTRASKINDIKNSISDLQMNVHQHNNTIYQQKKYIQELENEIQLIESHNKKIDISELVILQAELADISIEYNRLAKRKEMLGLASTLLKDTGIKSKIIKQYVPIINKMINKYLSMLDFFVEFTINEHFEEKILSRGRDNFTYSSFSEGEKFRINLAILFTWRAIAKQRNSINTNLLFLDEVFDSSLDVQGMDDFLKIINQTEVDNIFVISPKGDQIIDKFTSVLKFEKHKNFSQLVDI